MTATVFTPPDGPRGVVRPADAGSSLLGVYGDTPVAAVDRGGAVQLLDANWVVDWWIAAEDKLHTPASEASVRQARLGAGPVIQTSLRVPGGDIVQRVWATRNTSGSAVVLEFENSTPTPVGLALAVRPFSLSGQRSTPEVTLGSDRLDVGDSTIWLSGAVRDTVPELDAVVIPLPHKATTRALITTGGLEWPQDRSVPTWQEAMKGWDQLVTTGGRVVLPDDRLSDLFDQTRGRLSLGSVDLADRISNIEPGAGNELAGLCHGGMDTEALELLRSVMEWTPRRLKRNEDRQAAADVVDGLAWAITLYAPEWAAEFISRLVFLSQAVAKRGSDEQVKIAHRGLARVSWLADNAEAARSIDADLGLGVSGPLQNLEALTASVERSSEAASWDDDDGEPAAIALRSLRGLLLRESWEGHTPTIDLFPNFPAAWRGGSVELHSIRTAFGVVSAAIRWHGYRPALLWDIERADGITLPVQLRCSALDPHWSTSDRNGETLLAGVAEDLPEAPAEGESFS